MAESSLASIAEIEDSKAKGDLYAKFLNDAVAAGNIDACKEFVDHGE